MFTFAISSPDEFLYKTGEVGVIVSYVLILSGKNSDKL